MSNDYVESLLRKILAAQTLILARLLKSEKENKGTWSTSDYIDEAIKLLNQKEQDISRKM